MCNWIHSTWIDLFHSQNQSAFVCGRWLNGAAFAFIYRQQKGSDVLNTRQCNHFPFFLLPLLLQCNISIASKFIRSFLCKMWQSHRFESRYIVASTNLLNAFTKMSKLIWLFAYYLSWFFKKMIRFSIFCSEKELFLLRYPDFFRAMEFRLEISRKTRKNNELISHNSAVLVINHC